MPIQLPNGCHIGKMSVHPANWEEPTADLSADWYIHYRFHDPKYKDKYPKGYAVKTRGMNYSGGLFERRRDTRQVLDNEKKILQRGYNPIKGTIVLEEGEFEISPATPFATALQKAHALLQETKTKKEIGKTLVHIGTAIRQLRYESVPISEVRRKHIKAILAKISLTRKEATGEEWGASSYNHYRTYLDILFNQLDEVEATEVDPVAKIKKKRTTKKIKKVLSADEVNRINEKVWASQYTLWRFIHIFFHSGSRMSELMLVQRKHVDLSGPRFMVTVRKGCGEIEEVWKTITKAALPLWREIMREGRLPASGQRGTAGSMPFCPLPLSGQNPNDYLFSHELRPGSIPINERQVTKRWRIHVKKKLGIGADFYALKHKNTTEIVSDVFRKLDEATQVAAQRNSHKGNDMVRKNYDVERLDREHAALKDLDAQLN